MIAAFAVYVENYESSLASYAISVEEWMMDPQNMPEYHKINEEAITIGGLPVIKRFYTWNKIHQEDNSKIPIKAVDVYLLKDKKGYILEGQVVQDKFEQILPELEIMFNNFTLSGVTSEPAASESGLPPVTVTSEVVSSSTVSSTIDEIAFKFCPYCGTSLKPDYKFCPGCGNSIPVQRSVNTPKKIGVRNGNQTNINYPENLIQTRGFSEEINQSGYPRGMNKNFSKPFNSFKPAFISRSFGSKLVRLFPEKPLFPWAVSKRIMLGNYANLFPGSLGKTWVLRSSKKGAQKNVSMGSLIGGISSKIGGSVIDQTRSSSLLGGSLSILGQGITYEIGAKREAETLPSLTPTFPQTTPILPAIPPSTGPEGIVNPTLGAPAQGGITLTPPGQPVPSQPGPGGITLPTPGIPQEPQIIWKQYSLNQAFSHNPLIAGYLEYPSNWLVNLDSFNKNVTFSEDASGLTSLTLFPGLTGQFSSAQDLAQQMAYMLQQQVPDLSILNQEFKIVPTPGSGAIEVTEGK